MTRVPVPVLLRWPSWMRSDPRSAFPEISELAMVPPTPCIDAKTQLRLRTTEPKNYTDGSVQDRGTHIVTQPSAIRAEIPWAPGGRPGRRGGHVLGTGTLAWPGNRVRVSSCAI